jgi:hypothetical protein
VASQARCPRYIGALALTRLAAWLAVHRRQLLQRAEDDARGKTTMHGRRDDEDDDRPLSPTGRGHMTRGNFPRRFACVSFVRSPRARPERPGMAWARRMDEGLDPSEIEDPEA